MARMPARGFAYAEIMIAAVILALCAVPAANAIKNGIDAGQAGAAKTVELQCVRNLMETVMAEPYGSLNAAALNLPSEPAPATSYSRAAEAPCAARDVVIERKLFDGAQLTALPLAASDEVKETALLKVKVSMQGSTYAFTSVVAR